MLLYQVLELEAKLEEEITLRRKADEATAEALLKMHSAGLPPCLVIYLHVPLVSVLSTLCLFANFKDFSRSFV